MQSQQTLIMRQSLELGAELGQGEFGSVLKGVWTDPKGKKVWCCVLSFDANVSSFSLAESPPRDLQITAYK